MHKKLLLVDCYDSFTYNLLHLIEKVTDEIPSVIRVDECSEKHIDEAKAVIFSPGPGLPTETFELIQLVKYACNRLPVLGVCLGHQSIALAFGGELKHLNTVYHGMARTGKIIEHFPMYHAIGKTFDAASYHSWTVKRDSMPDSFIITAEDKNEEILSMRHKFLPVWGVQFHPESVLCPQGLQLIQNWFEIEVMRKNIFD
jgi:anthranilate synthase component II